MAACVRKYSPSKVTKPAVGRWDAFADFVSATPWLGKFIAATTLAFELSFPIALFVRRTRALELTTAGVRLLRSAEQALRQLDRTVEEVDPIERAVLRIAAYELIHRLDVPYRVVLNEAIETAKRFGSEHGHTYINGVLDHAAVEWRPAEAQARR